LRAFLLIAVALAACETPQPPPCPGTKVASFDFTATDAGTSCAFDGGPPPDSAFSATLAWDPDGTAAAICVQLPYAAPDLGTHAGDQVTVGSSSGGNTVSGCDSDCVVTISEVVDGGVTRDDGGRPTGFSGTLRNDLTGASPDGGTSCSCGLPCWVIWQLQVP
jgi:hypothetical protein